MENYDTFVTLLYVFCTLLAACFGSFANVVIYRVPEHKSIIYPPSTCPKCGSRIKPYDNIPVLSWLILRGKCRKCKNPISKQYPLVEGVCGIFGFLLCYQIFGQNADILFLDGVFWRLMLLFFGELVFLIGCLSLAIIDIERTEIPPEIALPVAVLGVIVAFALPETWPYTTLPHHIAWSDSLLGAGIGGALIVLIIAVYYLLTKRVGMGGGDIWMLVMIGAFLGWQSLPFIFLASSVQGIVAAVIAIMLGKKQQTQDEQGLFRNDVAAEINEAPLPETTGKLAVPYGPFLALAAAEYVFLGRYLLPLISGGALDTHGFTL